jgi:putative salt-induced outer membrane protein YdiY/Cu/Ag efflux protein CusF
MKQRQTLKLAALALCAFAAHADEVILKNGDKISGTVISKSGSVLEMKTDYADKVVIKWDAIDTLNSDKPMTVTLKDKQELTGLAGSSQNNSMTLKSGGVYDSQPIPLTQVDEINKKFFAGSANFGGGLSSGNTERQNYHGDANIIVRGRDDKVTLGGQYNYGDNTDVKTKETTLNARNWQLYGTAAHYFTPQWYGYAHGLFTNDRMQDIQLRSAFGVGAGYQFFASEDLNLSLEAGPDYVSTNFYDTAFDCSKYLITNPLACNKISDTSGIAGRWAVNYDQFVWNRNVQLFHTHEGLVSDALFIRSRTGFRVPIWNGIQFTNEVQVDYFSKPAPGKENTDMRYMFTIGYGW